jgi:uracil-DNA glycosylase family 4
MNESQRRAWQALGIGPLWRLRAEPDVDSAESAHARTSMPEPPSETALEGAFAPAFDAAIPAVENDRAGASPEDGRSALVSPDTLDWPALREAVAGCRACGLCTTRRNTVFGVGPPDADWMFVGEAPGEQEDLHGEPFVGPAGKLLDAMLGALGRARSRDVYIANVLKCRPPGNRDPRPDERAQCQPYLERQLQLVGPKLIIALGKPAANVLLDTDVSVGSLRGRVHKRRVGERDVPVVVTYHPAYLLRKPEDKAKAWADLVLALRTTRGG